MAMVAERMPFKDKLRELREKAKLTQQQLAVQSGLSISIVQQLEQGQSTEPRLTTIKKLARALGVSSDELIEMHSDEPEPPRKRGKKGGAS
jgi:transcriptional regulator with XRE-family HTH domain